MDEIQVKTIKGYEIVERLGAGGFGAVYRARQTTINREVAIKFIIPRYANEADFIRRFEVEAQIVARLEHPHITPLIDYWRDADGAYLVMRYLRGGSLRDGLDKSAFDLESTSRVLDQIASALAFAHRHDVIHRDIKPGNILLDEDGNAYLADFGIAKDLTITQSHTQPDAVIGSLDYISPEQARSEPITPRTDIYSLGVMLYEMITGEHPFKNATHVELLYKHISEPLPDIDNLPENLRDTINAIIQRATAKDPAQRYEDVLALAIAFRDGIGRGSASQELLAIEQMTLREHEILQLIADGLSNNQIAEQLFITIGTVKWHVNQLYKKLGVRNRVQAIIRAREMNLIVHGDADDLARPEFSSSQLSLPEPENPYKGLHAFQTADSRDFFGREELVEKLLHKMSDKSRFQRFLAVVGPSGSGKSSLVKAGLIPALWKGGLPDSEKWFVVDMMPGTHPLDELEIALTRVAANQVHNLREQLQRDERGLVRAAELILPKDSTELVVVVDQFEELFTLVEDEARRQHFLNLLATAVTDKRSRVRVVVTLRADYYDKPLHYLEFGEMLKAQMETVLPLSAKGLERAIAGPAERVGVTFEPGLVAQMVSEMTYQASALPLLQYALTELFEQRRGRLLTHAAYQEIGGAVGALANRAEEIFLSFNQQAQELSRQVFLRLVTLGEGAEDTRRRVERRELLALTDDSDTMEEILDSFAEHRLLALDHDDSNRQPTVEVAHEAILREWERLRTWLNESREDIRQERIVSQAAEAWHSSNRDKSYLLSGSRLEQAEKWRQATDLTLIPREREYIDASVAEHTAQQQAETERQAREIRLEQRSRNFLRALVAVLALATVLSGGFGIFALSQRNNAVEAREVIQEEQSRTLQALDTARRSGLAFAANSALGIGEVDLALALAMESVGDDDNTILPETRSVIEQLAEREGPVAYYGTLCGNSENYTVWLSCDPEDNTWSTFDPLTDTIFATAPMSPNFGENVQFSPDNQFLLVLASQRFEEMSQIEIWKTDDLTKVASFSINNPFVTLRWLWDSSMIATIDILPENLPLARDEGIEIGDHVTLRDAMTGEIVRQLDIDAEWYHFLNFSHDGTMGIVGGWSSFEADKQYQVTIFDTTTGATLYQFERPALYHPQDDPYGAGQVQFSPHDNLIWFGGYSGYIIDLATGDNYSHLHEFHVGLVRNYPSTDFEYGTSSDGLTVSRFNLQTGEAVQYENLNSIIPTLDENKIMVSFYGHNGEYYLWDTRGRNDVVSVLEQNYQVSFAAFSPDGKYLGVIASEWGPNPSETIIYDADTLEEAFRLDTHSNTHYDFTWSPDSQYIATGTNREGIILWDGQTGAEIRRFGSDLGVPFAYAEFTPDGRYLVAGRGSLFELFDSAPHIYMWAVETGELVQQIEMPVNTTPNFGLRFLRMHPTRNLVYAMVNETVFTSGSLSNIDPSQFSAYFVDLDTGDMQKIDINSLPHTAIFTPDGTELVMSTFTDNIIRVYDVETHSLARQWRSDQSGIAGIAISSDGRILLTNSSILASEPIIAVWDMETSERIRRYSGYSPLTWLYNVDFHPDGTRFVSTAFDGTVRVWNFDRQSGLDWIRENRYIRDLTCAERDIYRVEPLCDE